MASLYLKIMSKIINSGYSKLSGRIRLAAERLRRGQMASILKRLGDKQCV